MEDLKIDYVECACCGSEHILRFVYDSDENELYAEIQLVQYRNIFKRILVAIRYIFGYQSKYGSWDCWLLNSKDCDKIQKILQQVKDKK